jgi:Glucosyl transferase GtrII
LPGRRRLIVLPPAVAAEKQTGSRSWEAEEAAVPTQPSSVPAVKPFFGATQKRLARLFLCTLAITVLARALAFVPAYSIDDYNLVLQEVPPTTIARDGRFGEAALLHLFHQLQIRPQYAGTVSVAFALAAWALLATAVVRHWQVRIRGWLPFATAALIAIHPYSVELFTFRTALGNSAVVLALLVILIAPDRWSRPRILAGALLFALSLSIYQVSLHFALMVVAMGTAVVLTRLLRVSSTSRHVVLKRLPSRASVVWHRNSGLFAAVALGTAAYGPAAVLLVKILVAKTGGRTELLPLSGLTQRIREVRGVLWNRFAVADGFLNQSAKALLWVLAAACLTSLLVLTIRKLRWRSAVLLGAALVVLAGGVLWTVGIPIVLKDNIWPTARIFAHTGVFWAGILVMAHRAAPLWGQRLLGWLSLLIVLSFTGGNNRVLHDQLRLNARDAAKANRMVARLEALPGFTGGEVVAVHGRDWRYPLAYATHDHNTNTSAFGPPWSQVAILMEVSGYRFGLATREQQAVADAHCRGVMPWPAPASIRLVDGLAIICLEFDG